jgi:hypothetical protein
MGRPCWIVTVFAAALLSSCTRAPDATPRAEGEAVPSSQIILVRYSSVPGAHKIFKSDGTYSAGHLSGDPQHPSVHRDEGKLKDAEGEAIWAAAGEVDWVAASKEHGAIEGQDRFMELSAGLTGGRTYVIRWRGDDVPDDPAVQKLVEILSGMPYGGW